MTTLRAIILAAGEGTRMKSAKPKVLHMICGRPMIAYALNLVASVGVKQPVVVLGHGADAVKSILPKEAKLVIQKQQDGTGDAVLAAKHLLGGMTGDVLILYADTPLLRRTTVQQMIQSHHKHRTTATLLTANLANPSGYGRIRRNELGQVDGIVEEVEANAALRVSREINVGPLVCKITALFEGLAAVNPSGSTKELYLTRVIEHIAKQEGAKIQTVRVEEVAEALGINSRIQLAKAIGVIRQRVVDSHLQGGVTIVDSQTTFIDHGVSIGPDTIIHPYTVIESGVTIGRRCTVGPFARLRGGVALADDVEVGNFVELVRTKVSRHVRVKHFSYLGDASVEEYVNVGAGTITANYDGREKHQTLIGKGAFIGSNTVLVAPVKIGAGATTGAGCVVPSGHDVPPRSVVVGVPARVLVDGRMRVKKSETQGNGPARVTTTEKQAAPARSHTTRVGVGAHRGNATPSRPAQQKRTLAAKPRRQAKRATVHRRPKATRRTTRRPARASRSHATRVGVRVRWRGKRRSA